MYVCIVHIYVLSTADMTYHAEFAHCCLAYFHFIKEKKYLN